MHIGYFHYISSDDTASHHARQFVEAAHALGHRVDVCRPHRAEPAAAGAVSARRTLVAQVQKAIKRPLRRYLHEPRELLRNGPEIWRESRLLRSSKPDVLLVRQRYLGASGLVVASRYRLPLVVEANAPVAEALLYRDQYYHLPWLPETLAAWTLRRAAGITAVSSALKAYLVERYDLPEAKIGVVPNGASVNRFRPDTATAPELPVGFGVNTVVGFVGSFQRFHGPELLARMALRVAEARPDVRFLFVGDGPQAAAVRRITERLEERVLFTGHVDHDRVPGFVAAFDIAVMPESNFYGSPLKVIEWMAAGRAVVAPAYGPLREIIDSGREGLLFPPQDEDALVQQVLTLVDHPELREELGRRAAARVRRSLTWEDNARRVIEVCQNALAGHRAATAPAA